MSLFTLKMSLFTLKMSLFTLKMSLFTLKMSLFTLKMSLFTLFFALKSMFYKALNIKYVKDIKHINARARNLGLIFLENQLCVFTLSLSWGCTPHPATRKIQRLLSL
jgi:hypothetical protein